MNFQNRRQSLKRMHVQPMQMKWKFFFSCWLVICFFPHPFDCWIFILPFFFLLFATFCFPEQTTEQKSFVGDERETTEKCDDLDNDDFILFISLVLLFLLFFFFCKIVTGTFVPDERQTIDQKCTENTDEETSYCRDLSSETLWCLCWICLV